MYPTITEYTWTDPEETMELTFEVSGHYARGAKPTRDDPGCPSVFEDIRCTLIGYAEITDEGTVIKKPLADLDATTIKKYESDMVYQSTKGWDREKVQKALYQALPEREYTQ